MYTVVRELPPGSTPCARAKSAADFEPASAQRAVRASARGDFTREAVAIVDLLSSAPLTGLCREVLHPSHRRKWAWRPSRPPARYTTAVLDPGTKERRA